MKKTIFIVCFLIFCSLTKSQSCTPVVLGSTYVCQGGTGTMLYAYGTASYTWSPGINIIASYGDSVFIDPPNTGVYTYTVDGSGGSCPSVQIVVTVTVNPPPSITVHTLDDTICVGNTTDVLSSFSTPTFATYTWTAAPSAGIQNVFSQNSHVTPLYNGTIDTTFLYYLNVDVSGCPAYPTYTTSLVVMPCGGEIRDFSNSLIKIYPNPAHEQILIETNSSEKQTADLFDVNGRHLLSKILQPTPNPSREGTATTIDITHLNEGVYTLMIKSSNSVVKKKLIIVR
jgi:hypothetical protein